MAVRSYVERVAIDLQNTVSVNFKFESDPSKEKQCHRVFENDC